MDRLEQQVICSIKARSKQIANLAIFSSTTMTSKTFKDFDKLGMEPFANKLLSYIETEHIFTDEALTLTLFGEFGCGKSTFFEMLEEKVLTETDDTKNLIYDFSIIRLNAWKNDYENDALLSIVSNFIAHFEQDPKLNTNSLKAHAGSLYRFGRSIANDVVKKKIGVDFEKAGEKATLPNNSVLGLAAFNQYKERTSAFEKLEDEIKSIVTKSGKSLIILVDELDRCRPSYAVSYLETIKHLMDIKGLIFIFGVDKNSLSSSVESLYGNSLIFDEYYRKFSQRNINFPEWDNDHGKRFCRHMVKEYLHSDELKLSGRFSYGENSRYRDENIYELCSAFKLNPRSIHEVFRIMAHCLKCSEDANERMLWGWTVGTVFMSILSINNKDLYNKIGNQTVTYEDLADQLGGKSKLLDVGSDNLWWIKLIYLGVFGDKISASKVLACIQSCELEDENEPITIEYIEKQLSEFSQAYQTHGIARKAPYSRIHETIQELAQFTN